MATIKLRRPLKTHSGEVSEITLNEPSARAFIRYGEPFKTRWVADPTEADPENRRLEVDYNNGVMVKFLADMIEPKVDDLILEKLTAVDYQIVRSCAFDVIVGVAGERPTQP